MLIRNPKLHRTYIYVSMYLLIIRLVYALYILSFVFEVANHGEKFDNMSFANALNDDLAHLDDINDERLANVLKLKFDAKIYYVRLTIV